MNPSGPQFVFSLMGAPQFIVPADQMPLLQANPAAQHPGNLAILQTAPGSFKIVSDELDNNQMFTIESPLLQQQLMQPLGTAEPQNIVFLNSADFQQQQQQWQNMQQHQQMVAQQASEMPQEPMELDNTQHQEIIIHEQQQQHHQQQQHQQQMHSQQIFHLQNISDHQQQMHMSQQHIAQTVQYFQSCNVISEGQNIMSQNNIQYQQPHQLQQSIINSPPTVRLGMNSQGNPGDQVKRISLDEYRNRQTVRTPRPYQRRGRGRGQLPVSCPRMPTNRMNSPRMHTNKPSEMTNQSFTTNTTISSPRSAATQNQSPRLPSVTRVHEQQGGQLRMSTTITRVSPSETINPAMVRNFGIPNPQNQHLLTSDVDRSMLVPVLQHDKEKTMLLMVTNPSGGNMTNMAIKHLRVVDKSSPQGVTTPRTSIKLINAPQTQEPLLIHQAASPPNNSNAPSVLKLVHTPTKTTPSMLVNSVPPKSPGTQGNAIAMKTTSPMINSDKESSSSPSVNVVTSTSVPNDSDQTISNSVSNADKALPVPTCVSSPNILPSKGGIHPTKEQAVTVVKGETVLSSGTSSSLSSVSSSLSSPKNGTAVGPTLPICRTISPVPQTIEVKIIPGKLAVCTHCGSSSENFTICLRCKHVLPKDCKAVPDMNKSSVATNKSSPVISQKFPTIIKNTPMMKTVTVGKEMTVEKYYPLPVPTSPSIPKRGRQPFKKKKFIEEPECLTISDDDDPTPAKTNIEIKPQLPPKLICRSKLEQEIHMSILSKEPAYSDDEMEEDSQYLPQGGGPDLNLERYLTGAEEGCYTTMQCRTVRIGSYKVVPMEPVLICNEGFRIVVPYPGAFYGDHSAPKKKVVLELGRNCLMGVLGHFGRSMPVVFLYLRSMAGAYTRQLLGMAPGTEPYFDPRSEDQTHKRITLLPEKMPEETKTIIKTLFQGPPKDIFLELECKEANGILVRASPKDVQNAGIQARLRAIPSPQPPPVAVKAKEEIRDLLVYPPPPMKGGIPLNTDDYCCLGEDQFLNDAIIDFYLRYLLLSKLSEEDQHRTHVFSSFFYKRLTTRNLSRTSDSRLSKLPAAEQRHARVKSWTKNTNIFEKDFIIIPINEHAHWFLAIICFPGLKGCVRMSDGVPVDIPSKPPGRMQKEKKKEDKDSRNFVPEIGAVQSIQFGSTTITLTPVGKPGCLGGKTTSQPHQVVALLDDGSDRDEAEGDEEELANSDDDDDDDFDFDVDENTSTDSKSKIDEDSCKEKQKPDVDVKIETTISGCLPETGTSSVEADSTTSQGTSVETVIEPAKMEEKLPEPGSQQKQQESEINQQTVVGTTEETKPVKVEEDPKVPIKQPCILIFDSLAGAGRSRVVATLRDYLRIEYRHKMGAERDFGRDDMRGACPKVPQQNNFTDCGVYMLQYVESFFENSLKDFTIPIRTLHNWFPEDLVRGKREEIGKLIARLMVEQNVTGVTLPDIIFPSLNKNDEDFEMKQLAKGDTSVKCYGHSTGKMATNAEEKDTFIVETTPQVTTPNAASRVGTKTSNISRTNSATNTVVKTVNPSSIKGIGRAKIANSPRVAVANTGMGRAANTCPGMPKVGKPNLVSGSNASVAGTMTKVSSSVANACVSKPTNTSLVSSGVVNVGNNNALQIVTCANVGMDNTSNTEETNVAIINKADAASTDTATVSVTNVAATGDAIVSKVNADTVSTENTNAVNIRSDDAVNVGEASVGVPSMPSRVETPVSSLVESATLVTVQDVPSLSEMPAVVSNMNTLGDKRQSNSVEIPSDQQAKRLCVGNQ